MFTPIHTCPELIDLIQTIGFLPLLESSIPGFNAEAIMAPECRYRPLPDGGWEWPLWKWKGSVVNEGNCVYGKFFDKKAGFVSLQWWPHFLNWRRAAYPLPSDDSADGTIEHIILDTLRQNGSMVSRELRAACGMVGPRMRSRFDAYITRLQMGCYIVTEDFVQPTDKHGRPYGWGLSLLTTPEHLLHHTAPAGDTPQASRELMAQHLSALIPTATPAQIDRILK